MGIDEKVLQEEYQRVISNIFNLGYINCSITTGNDVPLHIVEKCVDMIIRVTASINAVVILIEITNNGIFTLVHPRFDFLVVPNFSNPRTQWNHFVNINFPATGYERLIEDIKFIICRPLIFREGSA